MAGHIKNYASGGQYSSTKCMDINICSAKYIDPNGDSVDAAASAIQSICEELLNASIEQYEIDIYETNYEVTNPDNEPYGWDDHRKNNLNWTHDGAWLLIHWDTTNGSALGFGKAWNDDRSAHASKYVWDKHKKETFQSVACHEILHCFIAAQRCDEITNQLNADDDHDLGREWDILYNPFPEYDKVRSVMVGGWTGKIMDSNCIGDFGHSYKDSKPVMTSCTKSAVELTAEHQAGQHN